MAKQSSGKKKAKVWYDTVVENYNGTAKFDKVERPTSKRQRRGF